MSETFDPHALADDYAYVEACPPELLDLAVALPIGTLPERLEGAGRWTRALLAGETPPTGDWPGPEVDAPVREVLARLGLPRFCREQPTLTSAVMSDVLRAFARAGRAFERRVGRKLRVLEALERRDAQTPGGATRQQGRASAGELASRARALACDRAVVADAPMLQAWFEQARLWSELSEVFGDLGDLLGVGRDLSRGVLHHTGWQDLLRLHALVAGLPELREIVRQLGRQREDASDDSVAHVVFDPMRRVDIERRVVATPRVPADVKGLDRGDNLARMLPSEAVLLARPALKMLWHARRAERALLMYRVEGTTVETIPVERESTVARATTSPRPTRGPIVAVIDTSGSMQGLPERLAKALVLEALRTAHSERRRCLLMAFGGPGELAEVELSLSADGLGRLLEFLGMSFGAGTDPSSMLRRVLECIGTGDWCKADVLVASDGEWSLHQAQRESVRVAREGGTRFHGLQIGRRGVTGLHALCDPVHEAHRWLAD